MHYSSAEKRLIATGLVYDNACVTIVHWNSQSLDLHGIGATNSYIHCTCSSILLSTVNWTTSIIFVAMSPSITLFIALSHHNYIVSPPNISCHVPVTPFICLLIKFSFWCVLCPHDAETSGRLRAKSLTITMLPLCNFFVFACEL